MVKKIIIGIVASVLVAEAVELSIRYKTWRYWNKALEEIPWPKK